VIGLDLYLSGFQGIFKPGTVALAWQHPRQKSTALADFAFVAVGALIRLGGVGLNKDWSGCFPPGRCPCPPTDRGSLGGFLISPEAPSANGHKSLAVLSGQPVRLVAVVQAEWLLDRVYAFGWGEDSRFGWPPRWLIPGPANSPTGQ